MSRSLTAAISAAVSQHSSVLAAVQASPELNLVSKSAADVARISCISAVRDRLTQILPTWAGPTRALAGLDALSGVMPKLAGVDALSGVMPKLAGLDALFRVMPQFTAFSSVLGQVEQ